MLMRKFFIVLLCLAVMASTAVAEDVKSGAWVKKYYVDDFNDPTDEWYITTALSGTFSNTAATNSELNGVIIVDSDSIAFVLYEYGQYRVINDGLSDKPEFYHVKIKDPAGKVYDFEGLIPSNGDRIFISDRYRQQVARILQGSGTVKFSVTPTDKSLPKYVFSIKDTSGFIDLFLENTLQMSSQASYTEKTEHYTVYTTNASGSSVNSSTVYRSKYDANGWIISRETVSEDFPATAGYIYENGQLVSSHEEGISGVLEGKTTETRVEDILYDQYGNATSKRITKYNVEKKTYKYNGYDYSYQYDENGNIVHEEYDYLTLDENGNVTERSDPTINDYSYMWNNDGTLQRKIRTTGKGKKYITDYRYDDFGRVVYEYTEPEDKSGSYWMTYERTYEYK